VDTSAETVGGKKRKIVIDHAEQDGQEQSSSCSVFVVTEKWYVDHDSDDGPLENTEDYCTIEEPCVFTSYSKAQDYALSRVMLRLNDSETRDARARLFTRKNAAFIDDHFIVTHKGKEIKASEAKALVSDSESVEGINLIARRLHDECYSDYELHWQLLKNCFTGDFVPDTLVVQILLVLKNGHVGYFDQTEEGDEEETIEMAERKKYLNAANSADATSGAE